MEKEQQCPICFKNIPECSRHIRYICRTCLETYPKLNEKGEEVEFFNQGWFGGFICKIKETGETNEDHVCFINNVKCWADEYRFGGIVIEAMTN